MALTVADHISNAIAKIGEKITLRRFEIRTKTIQMHLVLTFTWVVHIGVFAVLEGSTDEEALKMLLCTSLH